jgi:hypothetical protein
MEKISRSKIEKTSQPQSPQMDLIRERASTSENPSSRTDLLSGRWRNKFRSSHKDELYRKIVGEDPSKKLDKDQRSQELARQRMEVITDLETLWSKTQIGDEAKQMLEIRQQHIIQDSISLEKVVKGKGSPERRYRAQRNLQMNIRELTTISQQLREGVGPDAVLDASLQQIVKKGIEKQGTFLKEAAKYAEKDLDMGKAFSKLFVSHVEHDENDKNLLEITSKTKDESSYFINRFNVQTGEVIGMSNQKNPSFKYPFAEIMFHQLGLALKESGKTHADFDLKAWRGADVGNADVRTIFPHIREKKTDGSNEYVTGTRTYQRGSREFNLLFYSRVGQSKGFWEAQHQEAFKGKRFTSVTVDLKKLSEQQLARLRPQKNDHELSHYSLNIDWETDE